MSATERKFALTVPLERATTPAPEEEYVIIQMGVLNVMMGNTLCPVWHEQSLIVECDRRHGLTKKMVVTCHSCGSADTQWTSPRKPGARVFNVNVRSMQAIRSIGKGLTTLNDFWAVMNVSHRGLHQKTY